MPYKFVAMHLYSPTSSVLTSRIDSVAPGILVPSLLHENAMGGSPDSSKHIIVTFGVVRQCGPKPIEMVDGENLFPSPITGGPVREKDYLTLDKKKGYQSCHLLLQLRMMEVAESSPTTLMS